jgi:hypothetical protein
VQDLNQRQISYQSTQLPQQQFYGIANQIRTDGFTLQAKMQYDPSAARYPIAAAANTNALPIAKPVIPTANTLHLQGVQQITTAEQIFFRAFHAEPYQNTHPPPTPLEQTEMQPAGVINNPAFSNTTSAIPNVQRYVFTPPRNSRTG